MIRIGKDPTRPPTYTYEDQRLLGLPCELILKIFSYLKLQDKSRLLRCCTVLREIGEDVIHGSCRNLDQFLHVLRNGSDRLLIKYIDKNNELSLNNYFIFDSMIDNGSLEQFKILVNGSGFNPFSKYIRADLSAANSVFDMSIHNKYFEIVMFFLRDPRFNLDVIFDIIQKHFVDSVSNVQNSRNFLKSFRFIIEHPITQEMDICDKIFQKFHIHTIEFMSKVQNIKLSESEQMLIKKEKFIYGAKLGDISLIKEFHEIDPSIENNEAIKTAERHGRLQIMEHLLKDNRVRKRLTSDDKVRMATKVENSSLVARALEEHHVNPSRENNEAIELAYGNNDLQTMKILLNDERVRKNLSAGWLFKIETKCGNSRAVEKMLKEDLNILGLDFSAALVVSMKFGYLEIVALLLASKKVDPSSRNNGALRSAAEKGDLAITKLLLADERINFEKVKDLSITVNGVKGTIESHYDKIMETQLPSEILGIFGKPSLVRKLTQNTYVRPSEKKSPGV